MILKKDIEKLKQKIIQNNLDNIEEIINIELVKKSYINVKYMALETTEDYFLFFSSLNLLNSYVKKNYSISKKYNFKKEVSKGIESLITWSPEGINYSYNKSISIIDIDGLQFSFHNAEISELMEQKIANNDQIEWEGIKLQPVAVSVFDFANTLKGLSKKSMFGTNLEELYNETNINTIFKDFNEKEI